MNACQVKSRPRRPVVLVSASEAEALAAARLIHAVDGGSGELGIFDGRDVLPHPETLYVPMAAAATPLATLVTAAGDARIIVAVPRGALDLVDPELMLAAPPPIALASAPPCGPLCALPIRELGTLSYREVQERARQHVMGAYLVELMRKTRGNVFEAAQHADIERESMHRLLRRYGVHPHEYRV